MDFKSSANLTVLQRAPRAPRPLREQKDIELTSGCCCFKSSEGAVQLRVEAPADVYYLGASRAVNFTAWVGGCGGDVDGECHASVPTARRVAAPPDVFVERAFAVADS